MTGDRPLAGPGPARVDADPLAEFLKLAQHEGALEGENLEAFVTGLRERADRVIAERLGRAEAKVSVLESENQWQRETMTGLEGAVAAHEALLVHHREVMARLAGQLREIASLSPLRAREVARRLRTLADLLNADTR